MKWGEDKIYDTPESVKYEFSIGDRVETLYAWFFHTFTKRGTIIECKAQYYSSHSAGDTSHDCSPQLLEKGYKPYYKVKLDNGKTKWFWQYNISL